VAVLLLLLLNAGTLVFMFRWHADKTAAANDNGEGPAAFIIQTLQLDAQQQERFAGLRREHQQAIRLVRGQDRQLHDAYFGLLKTDHPDIAKVDSLAALIGTLENRLSKITFDHFQQLRALCRDDQKKRFDDTIDEIARRMGPGRRQQPGGPPPPGRERPGDGPPPEDGPPQ
jgi:hypothetical protein